MARIPRPSTTPTQPARPNGAERSSRVVPVDREPPVAPDETLASGPWIEPDGDDATGLTLHRRRTANASSVKLTASERDIARAILAGHSNAEIARRRGRAVRTVANQIAGLFRKLGVSSRTELVARWANGPEGN